MLFRNRRLIRATAALLLVQIGGELLLPLTASAISSPSQMEFVSYEAPGATDMVNLATGDFTYQVPLLEVPGPEMGFSVPLTYRAGIKLDQEASWTGLGWTLNPGAIVRNVNGYPDDANGDLSTSHMKQELARGWNAGIPGIVQLGWDSNTGHAGSVDLLGLASVGWNKGGIANGDLLGVGVGEGKISVDVGRMIGAAATIATLGGAAAAAGPANAAKAVALGAGKQLLATAAAGTAAAMIAAQKGGSVISGSQPIINNVNNYLFYHDYDYRIDNINSDIHFGSLYFNKLSAQTCAAVGISTCDARIYGQAYDVNTNGPVRDIKKAPSYETQYGSDNIGGDIQYIARPGDNEQANSAFYNASQRAISIAHDNFSVMAPHIGGPIRPQRLDIGTVPYAHKGSDHHARLNGFPYPPSASNYGTGTHWISGEKVQFRYENTLSNSYRWHKYENTGGNNLSGVDLETSGNDWRLKIRDPRLGSQRFAPPSLGVHTDQATASVTQGRYVQWWTNADIRTMYGNATTGNGNGFLEYELPVYTPSADTCTEAYKTEYYFNKIRVNRYSKNIPRNRLPSDGIGAFSVTDDDGTRYHFSLPVYQYAQYSYSIGRKEATNRGRDLPAQDEDSKLQSWSGQYYNKLSQPIAISWLLTAITGPDYKDQNANGVVDAQDVGGWVKFAYGKFGSKYKWRQPFVGRNNADDDRTEYHSEGYRDSYYLNSIQTRSHTALFIKSVRQDGRGHSRPGNTTDSDLQINESDRASSLRLDQIILLNNQDFAKLNTGTTNPNDGTIPAFSTNTANNASYGSNGSLGISGDSYDFVYDGLDVSWDHRIEDFLKERALKRIVFNYTYGLCPNVLNSFNDVWRPDISLGGKLTLTGFATYGPQNTKLMPDFAFRYGGSNPAYSPQKFDGFGMYSSVANASYHKPAEDFAQATADGAAWSLTEIITPLGAHTKISYERDQYLKVSNQDRPKRRIRLTSWPETSPDFGISNYTGPSDLRQFFSQGDIVKVSGVMHWKVFNNEDSSDPVQPGCDQNVSEIDCQVRSVSTSYIDFCQVGSSAIDSPFPTLDCTVNAPVNSWNNQVSRNYRTFLETIEVFVDKAAKSTNKVGDGIRVATISTWDDLSGVHASTYNYKNLSNNFINSSGVIAKEPALVREKYQELAGGLALDKEEYYDFYDLPDYPETPVIYSKVQVYKGGTGTSALDWTEKEEYAFHTPDPSMIFDENWQDYNSFGDPSNHDRLERFTHHVKVDIGKIGQLDWVKKSNRRGEVEMSSRFVYSNDVPNNQGLPYQGRFTEGVMTTDWLDEDCFRINRTVKEYQPTVLQKVITTGGSITTNTTNDVYDYFSGELVGQERVMATGQKVRSLSVPAYLVGAAAGNDVYARMKAIGEQPSNAPLSANYHMLKQTAATYAWLVRPNGPTDYTPDPQAMLSATAQTWRDAWTTNRGYDGAVDRYKDTVGLRSVARQADSYSWHSATLQPDGTFASFSPFWGNTSIVPAWIKAQSALRYDNYSAVLESYGLGQQYTAQKNYFSNSLPLATAGNARYTEIAYCGLEDAPRVGTGHTSSSPNYYYGGEVKCTASRSAAYHHTGEYALEVPATSIGTAATGLSYRATLKRDAASELTPARKYRISTWVHSANAAPPSGRVFASLRKPNNDLVGNWSANVDATSQAVRADGWYRLEMVLTLPTANDVANQTLELTVGCDNLNGTGTVYFDDFRFQPLDAALQAYVYDPHTSLTTYVLDNDNFYSHYEYDAAGRVVKSWQEAIDKPGAPGGARLVSKKIYHYRGMN